MVFEGRQSRDNGKENRSVLTGFSIRPTDICTKLLFLL